MGRFSNEHPDELRELIARTIADGATAASVHRAINAGTLAGWEGPYSIPYETCRSYGLREKKNRASMGVDPSIANDAFRAIDRMAYAMLTEASDALNAERRKKGRDLEKLGDIADLIKKAKALIEPSRPKAPSKSSNGKPKDPLTAVLTAE